MIIYFGIGLCIAIVGCWLLRHAIRDEYTNLSAPSDTLDADFMLGVIFILISVLWPLGLACLMVVLIGRIFK